MFRSMRRHILTALAAILLAAPATYAQESKGSAELGGHVKGRYTYQSFPDDSIYNELVGSSGNDATGVLRLKLDARRSKFDLKADYQLFALYGDQVEVSREFPPPFGFAFDRLPNDRRRLFDLTSVIEDEGKLAVVHRLDRLSAGYTGEKTVVRFGRQAITWGNGLFFAPLDIVNPFDPAAVDTEFKVGDDMLLAQYLQDNGNDTQLAVVFRRDPVTGDVEADQSTAAAKYHGAAGSGEYDLFVAHNYGDWMGAVGGNVSLGGAVLRGDLVLSDTESEGTVATFVANYSYSWIWGGKNVSGAIEYFFNGFGQRNGDYSDLADNEELLQRLARGELFTLGRHYLAGSLMVEMTPLWQLTPNVFANVSDGSALAQLVTQHSLGDNLLVLGALNVPVGPSGTEYGGLEIGVPGVYLSYDFSVFAQLAWYF